MTRYALYGTVIDHKGIPVVLNCVPRPIGSASEGYLLITDGGHGKGFESIATAFEIARRDWQRYVVVKNGFAEWEAMALVNLPRDASHLRFYSVDNRPVYCRNQANAVALKDTLNNEHDHRRNLTGVWSLLGMTDTPRITVRTYQFQPMLTIEGVTPLKRLDYRVGDLVKDDVTGLFMEIAAVLKDGQLRLLPYTASPRSEDMAKWISRAMTDPIFDGSIQLHTEKFIRKATA